MLLLSSPRRGRQRRARLLPLLAALLLGAVPVGASLPAASKCPSNCAREHRDSCKPGSSHCGPCLSPWREDVHGHCVMRKRPHQPGKVIFYPDLDEEIDYLQSVIAKQVSETSPITKQTKRPVSLPADITSQTDVKKSKIGASKNKQKNQDRSSSGILPAPTAVPHSEISALPTPSPPPRTTGDEDRAGHIGIPIPKNDRLFVIIISVSVAVGTAALILAAVCYAKLQKESRLAQKVDYPAFGGAGVPAAMATGTSMGDKTLAKSAQMYHYQHQKQQMLSMGNHKPEQKVIEPEVTSDEEEVGGDFTVYECPGLAPTGEMEVKNPLFDDSTIHYQGNNK